MSLVDRLARDWALARSLLDHRPLRLRRMPRDIWRAYSLDGSLRRFMV